MKLILFKKSFVIALAVILASGVILGICCGVAAKTTLATAEKVIVIDAGHGGADGGVVGATTGTKESDVNLGISKYLMKHFKEAGYNVVLTRSDAGAVSGGIKYIKREDMRARKNIVESAAPDVLISVHCNSYPVASVKGAQVFYSSGASTGKNIAETVQNYFNEILNERPRTAAVGDYYMLNCSTYPSILCECGFLSNQTEENKLITASYQEKVAYTIFTAVNSVFGERA